MSSVSSNAGSDFVEVITSYSFSELNDIAVTINQEYGEQAAKQFLGLMLSIATKQLSSTELYDVYLDKAYASNRPRGVKFIKDTTGFKFKTAVDTYDQNAPMFVGVTESFIESLNLTSSLNDEQPYVLKVVRHIVGAKTLAENSITEQDKY